MISEILLHTLVHNLLQDGQVEGLTSADVIAEIQSFEFDWALLTNELQESGLEALSNDLFPYPANYFYFQWSMTLDGRAGPPTGALGVVDVEHGAVTVCFATLFGDGMVSGPQWCSFDMKPHTSFYYRDGSYDELCYHALKCVLSFSMALRCRDVIVHDCGPSPAIKRKREKRGLPPIIEFKKVTIKPELRGIYEAASKNFERNGPRLHFRRGHIRNLPQGKGQTYVSPCWVGNAALGVVEKQYEVKQ